MIKIIRQNFKIMVVFLLSLFLFTISVHAETEGGQITVPGTIRFEGTDTTDSTKNTDSSESADKTNTGSGKTKTPTKKGLLPKTGEELLSITIPFIGVAFLIFFFLIVYTRRRSDENEK